MSEGENSCEEGTCVRPCMALQIKSIVETFAAKCTQISLNFRVTFCMSVQQPLQCKLLQDKQTLQ